MNISRQVKIVLYKLKRLYAQEVDIFVPKERDVNLQTGKISRSYTKYTIKRAILMPVDSSRNFIYDLSFIAANRNFTEGGFFDKNQVTLILEATDVRFDINQNLSVQFNGDRYEIKDTSKLINNRGYVLSLSGVTNQDLISIINQKVHTCVGVSDEHTMV